MAVKSLPLRPDLPAYRYRTTLEGRRYVVRLVWSQRAESWYFSLGLPDGTWLAEGVRVVCLWPLTHRIRDERHPPGRLIAWPLDGDRTPPGRDDLGSRVRLLYFPRVEVEDVPMDVVIEVA